VPTNKLWIEHTEQAAWQSVDALREKLALAEQRQQRLAPPVEGWRELCDALDAAKREHELPGDSYAKMIRGLLERIAAADERARTLEQTSPGPVIPGTLSIDGPRWRAGNFERALRRDDDEVESDAPAAGEARLFREIRVRYQRLVRERARDTTGLLADIEARLGELPDLDPGELADAAADLAALSLVVARRGGLDE
jgi:hypothetical protein